MEEGDPLMQQSYITILDMEEFVQAREQLSRMLSAFVSEEMAHTQHGDLEAQVEQEGREFLRGVFQGLLDLRTKAEPRLESVTGEDDIVRNHRRNGCKRELTSLFGPVLIKRIGYGQRGQESLFPLDGELNRKQQSY